MWFSKYIGLWSLLSFSEKTVVGVLVIICLVLLVIAIVMMNNRIKDSYKGKRAKTL